MNVSIDVGLDTTTLKSYIATPFFIEEHQCYVENTTPVFVPHKLDTIDYYGISLQAFVVDQDVKKNTVLCVTTSEPFNILKQIAFYRKCKEINLNKERYMYAKMLAEQLAEVEHPSTVAKPSIDNEYNCINRRIDWKLDVHGHSVQGWSMCVVACKDIKRGDALLYKQEAEGRNATRARILERYPIVFELDDKSMIPKNDIDVPVYLDGELTNFMHVKEKNGPYVLRFPELGTYNTQCSRKRRKHIHLKSETEGYKIVKVVNPII